MAQINTTGSGMQTSLQALLMSQDIQPGSHVSYQTCKVIYSYHPLGFKMAESPIKKAQSQERIIEIPGAPDRVKKAFIKEFLKLGAKRHIRNFAKTSRIYGIASIACLQDGIDSAEPINFSKLWNAKIAFNVFDPLNTAGSLVLNQFPNAMDFQKHDDIVVSGQTYHRSRTMVMLNEEPVYIEYTDSAFGFVGRSVYQRALYPLKSFIQSMQTDDLVTVKAGVIVAKMKQVTSAVNNVVAGLFGVKRDVVKEAVVSNVISIGSDEAIETLNMQNLDGAYGMARTNILKNIATACDMPAIFLGQETMVEGFGEGTEDAKNVANYIDELREAMQPAYDWFDRIAMYRAWNPDFYRTIQAEFPEQYGDVDYDTAFYQWSNAFEAEWPSLLTEPDSEKIKADDVKLKAMIAAVEIILPVADPENKAKLVEWLADSFNTLKLLFPNPLELNYEALAEFEPPVPLKEPAEPKPFAAQDSNDKLLPWPLRK